MRPFDTLIRLSEQILDEKRRALGQLEATLAAAVDHRRALDAELEAEQASASGSVEAGFIYGAYAQEMVRRRARADAAVDEATAAVEAARDEVQTAFAEFKRYEMTHNARLAALEAERARKEQAVLDETAQILDRRKDDRL